MAHDELERWCEVERARDLEAWLEARKIRAGIPRTHGEDGAVYEVPAGTLGGAYWGGRSYSRGELERAVAAAEKDVLARFRGRLVAFLEDGEAVVVEGVPRDTAAVSLGTASFSRSEVNLTVRFKIRQQETPEERGRREGREVGLELARRAASETMARWHPDLLKQVIESINKAAEAAKEER